MTGAKSCTATFTNTIAPVTIFPPAEQTAVGLDIALRWSNAVALDGRVLTYDRCLRADDANFIATDCVPVPNLTALLGIGLSSSGLLLIGIMFSGQVGKRRRIVPFIVLLLVSGTVLISCSGGAPPPPSTNTGGTNTDGGNGAILPGTGTGGTNTGGGSPPPSTNTGGTDTARSLLESNRTYYWKVVAKDGSGAVAESAVSSFTTE